ncbi:MAG: hypothetical protein AAF724_04665 [Pseudomonadota bacterium]
MNIHQAVGLNPGCATELAWADEAFAAQMQPDLKAPLRRTGWRLPMARISRQDKPRGR